jgi:hypothetical protein
VWGASLGLELLVPGDRDPLGVLRLTIPEKLSTHRESGEPRNHRARYAECDDDDSGWLHGLWKIIKIPIGIRDLRTRRTTTYAHGRTGQASWGHGRSDGSALSRLTNPDARGCR